MSAKLSWIAEADTRWVGMLGCHAVATVTSSQDRWLWTEMLSRVGRFEHSNSLTAAKAAAERSVLAWLEGAGLNRRAI